MVVLLLLLNRSPLRTKSGDSDTDEHDDAAWCDRSDDEEPDDDNGEWVAVDQPNVDRSDDGDDFNDNGNSNRDAGGCDLIIDMAWLFLSSRDWRRVRGLARTRRPATNDHTHTTLPMHIFMLVVVLSKRINQGWLSYEIICKKWERRQYVRII